VRSCIFVCVVSFLCVLFTVIFVLFSEFIVCVLMRGILCVLMCGIQGSFDSI